MTKIDRKLMRFEVHIVLLLPRLEKNWKSLHQLIPTVVMRKLNHRRHFMNARCEVENVRCLARSHARSAARRKIATCVLAIGRPKRLGTGSVSASLFIIKFVDCKEQKQSFMQTSWERKTWKQSSNIMLDITLSVWARKIFF